MKEVLVNVMTFLYRREAEQAKGLLADEGIEAIVSADDLGGYRPHLAFGGVSLSVKREDYDKAQKILKVLEIPAEDKEDAESQISRLKRMTVGIHMFLPLAIILNLIGIFMVVNSFSIVSSHRNVLICGGMGFILLSLLPLYSLRIAVKAKKELKLMRKTKVEGK